MSTRARKRLQLSSKKRDLVKALLQKEGLSPSHSAEIPRRSQEGPAQLSPAQHRLWLVSQVEDRDASYNVPVAMTIDGPLRVRTLGRCLALILRRHQILRSVIRSLDGRPHLVVPEQAAGSGLSLIDLSRLPEPQGRRYGRSVLHSIARVPFDLERGPLFRAALVRFSDERHALLLNAHHIVMDGWSVDVLLRELTQAYRLNSAQESPPLPELPIQYSDFARWQREHLRGQELQRQKDYWKRHLSAPLPELELPIDFSRPPRMFHRGGRETTRLAADTSRLLRRLSRDEKVTLFMTLLALWKVLLLRYSGQTDIIVGTPIANRDRRELKDLIGFFANTLALRTDLSGDPSFRTLLSRVREVTTAAYRHPDLPFESLVEEIGVARDPSRHPLFQVAFVLQNFETSEIEIPHLALGPLQLETKTAKFDLTLEMVDDGETLEGCLEYDSDLFKASTAARMLRHFRFLAQQAASHPDRRLSRLRLLRAEERRQAVETWNQTSTSFPHRQSICALFEAQAAQRPQAVALSFQGCQLSYGELNRQANKLARHMTTLGVDDECPVAVYMNRSPQLIVCFLAILKAGGAYLPLDPDYPPERLSFMLKDGAAKVLLTNSRIGRSLPEHSARTVCLERDWEEISRYSPQDLSAVIPSSRLAYIMYTSGSTGRPKGIGIPHQAVVRLVLNTNYIGLEAGDILAQASNSSFDAATFEIWGALLAGARLVGLQREVTLSPQQLSSSIARHQIGILFLTTALFNQMSTVLPGGFGSLKHLLFGGEAVDPERVRNILRNGPPRRLLHVYGPTESTTYASWHLVKDVPPRSLTVPIGKPLANTRIYLLDENLEPLPAGLAGGLFIAGQGLARGYWKRPSLTAERFIPDPFSPTPGGRMYRTGDLARFQEDGSIEFLGRRDHQVKIRGFRIELPEIEIALGRHPQIAEVCVTAPRRQSGDRCLVAYFAVKGEKAPSDGELRDGLSRELPSYMIPAAFVRLESLPLNANGKVDHEALPQPDLSRPRIGQTFVEPTSEEEKALAEVWRRTLALEKVGINDSFYQLGGDSIVAIQLAAQAGEAGFRITPNQIFRHPTIAGLLAQPSVTAPVRSQQGPVTGCVEMNPVQRWFLEQEPVDFHHFNQAMLLKVSRGLCPAKLQGALNAIMAHHDALRLRLRLRQGEWEQSIGPVTTASLIRIDLQDLPSAASLSALQTCAAQLQTGLDPARGLLVRAALFEWNGASRNRLLIVIHHWAVDGVSWRVLLEDLEKGYRQLEAGSGIELGRKTTSFQEWCAGLADLAGRKRLKKDLDFWREHLDGPVGRLPLDFPKEENRRADERACSVSLEVEATRRLLQIASPSGAEINALLLTALYQALRPWISGSTLLVAMEGHGREEILEQVDLVRTVGWFTSIFPLRIDLSGCGDLTRELEEMQSLLAEVPNRGIGYGILRYLHPDAQVRDRLRSFPTPQVSFNYLGQFDQSFSSSALFRPAPESIAPFHSPRGKRPFLLEINSLIIEGKLTLHWGYSSKQHRRATVAVLADRFMTTLSRLLSQVAGRPAGPQTGAFPLARIEPSAMERLMAGRGPIHDLYPLSPMQKEMLWHTLALPHSDLPVVQYCWQFEELDPHHFKKAWAALIERHAVLRTSFFWDHAEEPLQAVHERVDFDWKERDWSPMEEQAAREGLETLLEEERRRGFRLDAPPLMHFVLVKMPSRLHALVWSFHHIILDGWCQSLILDEVSSHYEASRQGRETRSQPARPFAEYIAWMGRQDLQQAESYWRSLLREYPEPTPLWTDQFPASGDRRRPIGIGRIDLSRRFTSRIRSLAGDLGLTLNTLIQGAWAVLLAQSSQRDDVVFGLTVSGRPADLRGVESMLGLFINNIPVRVKLVPESELLDWLRELQEQLLESRRFEYVSQSQILEWSGISPQDALFESIIVYENYPREATRAGAQDPIQFQQTHHLGTQTGRPLTLLIEPAERLPLRLLYQRERFSGRAADILLQHLKSLLEAFLADPVQSLGALPPFSPKPPDRIPVQERPRWRGFPLDKDQIEAEMRKHPALNEAFVVVRKTASGRKRLVAYLTERKGETCSIRQLRRSLEKRLGPAMLPSDFVLLPQLPKTSQGQVKADLLPDPERSRSWRRRYSVEGELKGGGDVFELRLRQLWEEVFDLRPLDGQDNFFDLGGDSFLAVRLMTKIQEQFGKDLPLSALFGGATIRELAQQLRRHRSGGWSSLVPIKPGGSRPPLFCVHPAGGNVVGLSELVAHLDKDLPFYGIQALGLKGDREPLRRVEEMAGSYLKEVLSVQDCPPYFLAGQSFGGFVAYEMARRLMQRGREVAFLGLIDTWSPVFRGAPILDRAAPDEAVLLSDLAATAAGLYGKNFSLPVEELRSVAPQEQIDYALKRLEEAEAVPPIGLEQTRRILRVHHASVEALRHYRAGPYAGRITLFRAEEEEKWMYEMNPHPAIGDPELYLGWASLTPHPLDVVEVPGGHSSMMVEPHVRALAQAVSAAVQQSAPAIANPTADTNSNLPKDWKSD
ncbi:MAG TPA: amino acid adenylation domain-containing protein [Acidobacteriota bacterium]|nr:amino acid adenylation domain-containing protein [Acidobacteriota bacterium]